MVDNDSKFYDDFFDDDLSEISFLNSRKCTRYVRKDIFAKIMLRNIFGFRKIINAELKDISSRGVLIYTPHKLRLNKKIILALKFKDDTKFIINAKVVRKHPISKLQFGIKFDKQENELADYLLETQTDLIFK